MITKILAAVNKFVGDLNDLQKKLLIAALVIVVLALFDRLLIGPTMSRLSAIDAEINHEEKSIKQDLKFLSYKDRIVKEQREIEGFITKEIPTEEELISAFLKTLEGLAAKANINIAKVSPSTGSGDGNLLKYQADLECSGKLADIVTFMHLVDSSDELLKVTKYNLFGKKADAEDNIKVSMTVEKVIVSAGVAKPTPASPKDAPVSQ